MIARDSGHARSFRDAAASDLNDFDVGPAFDQGFVRLARSRVQFLSHPHAHLQQSSRCCASGNQPLQNSHSLGLDPVAHQEVACIACSSPLLLQLTNAAVLSTRGPRFSWNLPRCRYFALNFRMASIPIVAFQFFLILGIPASCCAQWPLFFARSGLFVCSSHAGDGTALPRFTSNRV